MTDSGTIRRGGTVLEPTGGVEHQVTRTEQALIDAALSLTANLNVRSSCTAMLEAVERIFQARSSWILLYDHGTRQLVTETFRGPGADIYGDLRLPSDQGIVGLVFTRREIIFVPDVHRDDRWFDPARVRRSGLQSVFAVPLLYKDHVMGVLGLDSPLFREDSPPGPDDLARVRALAAHAAISIKHAQLFAAAEEDRQRLRRLLNERRQLRSRIGHLQEEVRDARGISTIVGQSPQLLDVLAQVKLVAPADSTVLIVGETGTGKEIIARAIHEQSRRASCDFVAVNCAALPDTLVESELFGHEKGAFTGALARKPGKFELADRGTLFMDEIGDLPSDAQAKLLRVLQEREVQRVGGVRPVPVNVRLIAATNKDLEACIADGRFRPDLYFRLSVFPIVLPPLRDRRQDVPPLVHHFVKIFAERQHRPAPRVPADVMARLVDYDWPGNVRELQNVIERAVILTKGDAMTTSGMPLGRPARPARRAADGPAAATPPGPARHHDRVLQFEEAERRAILRALEQTGWRISGRGAAADVLGLKPTTLHAKMKKLGIRRPSLAASASL